MRFLLPLVALGLLTVAYTQDRDRLARRIEQSRSWENRKGAINDPFIGLTTNGTVQPNLFRIKPTGVSTAPMREAAKSFLSSLTAEQRTKTLFASDDIEWRKWMNQDFYIRAGMGFADMTNTQREAAWALLRASLSPKGYQLSRDIMHLNETLGELSGDMARFGEFAYWISIMGEPSPDKPWGWQLDGHHLIINYFVLGDQIVMTPTFLGSEPVIATSGKYKGTVILQQEQADGLKMLQSLRPDQQAKAILNPVKTTNLNRTEAFQDNAIIPYEGISARDLDKSQRAKLLALVRLFVSNMRDGHTRVKMDEVSRHLDDTWFAWVGGKQTGSVYYFRIQSPVISIEFDHQLPVGLRSLSKNPTLPEHDHIHVVIRTPNGNDYGKDLLRQHLLAKSH